MQDIELQNVLPISSNAVNFEISLGNVLTLDLFQVMEAEDKQCPREQRALVDNGSQATTTKKNFSYMITHPSTVQGFYGMQVE